MVFKDIFPSGTRTLIVCECSMIQTDRFDGGTINLLELGTDGTYVGYVNYKSSFSGCHVVNLSAQRFR